MTSRLVQIDKRLIEIESLLTDYDKQKISLQNERTELIGERIAIQEIEISEQEKNILLMAGCFCPPHKGHFEMLRNNIIDNDRAYVFIWDGGGYRHGFYPDENLYLWSNYIKLLPADQVDKVHLIKLDRAEDIHPVITGIKHNMNHYFKMALEGKKINFNILLGSDYTKERVSEIKDKLEIKDDKINGIINVSFKIIERRTDGISATNFVRSLTYRDFGEYLPDELDIPDNKIIRGKVYGFLNSKADRRGLSGGEKEYFHKHIEYKINYDQLK